MNMEEQINNHMKGAYARFARKGQITLGALITLLKNEPADHQVVYDFAGLQPTSLGSYRGYYEHLALGHTCEMSFGDMSVAQLLAELEAAVDKVYEGYKGGDYRMGTDTPLWVANYGSASGAAVVGVRHYGHVTVITTAYVED